MVGGSRYRPGTGGGSGLGMGQGSIGGGADPLTGRYGDSESACAVIISLNDK